MHDIVGNSEAFFFGQFFTKATHKFACASRANAMAKLSMSPRVRMDDENK